jgi:hypothetical protein
MIKRAKKLHSNVEKLNENYKQFGSNGQLAIVVRLTFRSVKKVSIVVLYVMHQKRKLKQVQKS